MLHIEIIGTVDKQRHYDTETIKKLLLLDAEMLKMGLDFVGRPGTRIHANETDVIKIRTELNFTKEQSRRWIKQVIEKEQQLAIHHPHKTWLLITEQREPSEPETIAIASICPRLKPLHSELKAAPSSASERQRYLDLFTAVFRLYLTLAKQTNVKLDEGLSNFAVAEDGIVYYLDDEYYQWDKFVSFALMIGVYIRSFDWLDSEFIDNLGLILVDLIKEIFQDSHGCIMLARQLHSLFMPVGQKEQLLQNLIQVLMLKQPTPSKTTVQASSPLPAGASRYFALLADVHANYAALDTVLNYLDAHNIEQGIVLGDIVGYHAEPKECIARLQTTKLQIIKGNHDHAVATQEMSMGFSSTGKTILEWSIKQLSQQERDWLANLPAYIETDDWFAVHGAPMDPAFFYGYVYTMTYEDNLNYMQKNKIRLCFHGHSHIPMVFARDKKGDHSLNDQKIVLSAYQQLLVCPGSVGQPRNAQTNTQFAIYDRELQELSYITLPYDVEATIQKMRDNNFPESLSQRLLTGK